jgi:hypothetical protein
LQFAKERSPRKWTPFGRIIDLREEQPKNAFEPILERWDPASNINTESEVHPQKQSLPSSSTDEGIAMD